MLKYVDTRVCFAEVPDEITLCINLSNCPCHCKGCHSPYLAKDIGEELNEEALISLIEANKGISCVAFMGGDSNPHEIHYLAMLIREVYPKLKIAWYSGREQIHIEAALNLQDYDFIKLGPYIAERGPLDNPNTNQKLFQIVDGELVDVTHKFWKHEIEDKSKENK